MYSYSLLPDSEAFRRNAGWFIVWGILLMILGIAAASLAYFTTMFTVMVMGAFIFIGGVILLFDTFKFWWGRWNGFLLHFVLSILYILMGAILFKNPVFASVSLTFLLGFFYLLAGCFRLIYTASIRSPRWFWSLLSAIISLLLGIFILYSWPISGFFIIGLFIGIDLFFVGLTYMMLGIAAKTYA